MKFFSFFFCVFLLFFLSAELSFGGDYLITRWRKSAPGCKKGATVTVKYEGSGSRFLRNSCFRAIFEDGFQCDAESGDFEGVQVSNGKIFTRSVCFCNHRYKINDILYTCKDSF